jgi:hypothetical protein
MLRTRMNKRLELTARDSEIFKLLHQYRYLRSTYIHAFVGGASATRFKERLGDLFHEGYIDRPGQQWELAKSRCSPAVYETGKGSAQAVRAGGIDADDTRTFLADTAHRQFLHSLMICEIMASVDIAIRASPNLRFIAWPEILRRAPQATQASLAPFRILLQAGGYLVPDGLFGIEYTCEGKKSYRFFVLEADRGTMPITRSNRDQTSYLGKMAAYREIIAGRLQKKCWGIPNLLVLTVTTSDARKATILEKIETQPGDHATLLFKAIDPSTLATPVPQLLFEPWQRAGFAPLQLCH